jgi:hypothetical protein
MTEGTSAAYWREKREVYLFTNMHSPPSSGHFVGQEGNASKPLCIGSYNKSMGFVDVNDKINSNSISCNTWKWPKKTLLLPT